MKYSFWLSGLVLLSGCTLSHAQLQWQPLREPGIGGWATAIRVSPHDSNHVLIGGDMLGVGLSVDGGQSWGATTGFTSWETNDFTFDPKNPAVVWIGTLSGIYKSTDGGKSWTPKRNGFPKQANFGFSAPIERVLIDPNNPARLIAFGGSSRGWDLPGPRPLYGAIWESTDGGENWKKIATLSKEGSTDDATKGVSIYSMGFAAGSSQTLYASAPGAGFFISNDGGKNWTKSIAGLPHANVSRIVSHPRDPRIVFAALNSATAPGGGPLLPGGIWKSTDGGQNWASISTGLSQVRDTNGNFTARYSGLGISEINPDLMYTADTAWNTGVLYSSKDGGKLWNKTEKNPETAYPAGAAGTFITVDPKNPNVAFQINSEHILKTSDGGKTWQDSASQKIGTDTWRGRGYSGMCSWNFTFNPFQKGQSLWQAMDAGRAWVSDDNLNSWRYGKGLDNPQPWGGGKFAAWAKDGTIYITTGQHGKFQGIGKSSDGGKTWKIIQGGESGLPAWDTWNEPDGIYTLPDDSKKVWAVVGKKLLYSSDGGQKWDDLKVGYKVAHIAADTKNPLHFYVSGESSVLETTDGATFKAIGGPRKAGRVTVDSLGRLYVAADLGQRGGLWRYEAGKWARLWDDKQILGVAVDPTNPNRVAITTNMDPFGELSLASGVWISADAGASWSQQNDGLAMLRGHAIAFDPFNSETLVFGSFGRGFWKTSWPETFAPKGKSYVSTAEDVAFASAIQIPSVVAETPTTAALANGPRLINGDMSGGDATPENWTTNWTGRGRLTASRDTTTFKSAPASLKIETTGDTLGQQVQTFEVQAGAKFTVSGWMKTSGTVKANFMLQPVNAAYTPIGFIQIGYAQNDSDWRQFSKEITIPKDAVRANLGVLVEGEGRAWLDDVKITVNGAEVIAQLPAKKEPVPIPADVPLPAKDQKPAIASSRADGDWPRWWFDMHKGFVARLGKEPKPNVIFFGDSITQYWGDKGKEQWDANFKPLGAVNFGIAGDKVQNVLWRVQNGELDGASPKLIVLKIGVNNILGNNGSDTEIVAGIGQILNEFKTRIPGAKVLLLGILPSLDTNTDARKRTKNINAQLSTFAGGNVRFLDIGDKLLTADGTLTREIAPDWVHLSPKGYEIFAANLVPVVREILSAQG